MIRHMVLFRWHENATAEAIEAAAVAMRGLAAIDCVSDLQVGANLSPDAGGYGFVLSFSLPDLATLDSVFRPHPAHKAVSAAVRPIMAGKILVDITLAP